MVLHCRLSSEGRQRRINTKKGASGPPKTIKEKKKYMPLATRIMVK
jgi:hypothetical protein